MKITKRQREILNFITEYTTKHEYAPSYREIAEHLGLSSPATVHQHIAALEEKKLLSKGKNEARSLNLSKKLARLGKALQLPLAGLITAGEPIEAIENPESVSVPEEFVTAPAKTYVLRVEGDSMIEEGILDGDYVVVEQHSNPTNGDVIVALLEREYATLKKFYKEKNGFRLQPANSSMKPIFVKQLDVQGVVKGVMRKL